MIYYLFLGGFQEGPLCEIQNESWKPLFEHFWPPQERSKRGWTATRQTRRQSLRSRRLTQTRPESTRRQAPRVAASLQGHAQATRGADASTRPQCNDQARSSGKVGEGGREAGDECGEAPSDRQESTRATVALESRQCAQVVQGEAIVDDHSVEVASRRSRAPTLRISSDSVDQES